MKNSEGMLSGSTIMYLCTGLAILLLVGDYFSGPFIQFPITYLLPISIISWYNGRRWALLFAVTMPLIRLVFNLVFWTIPWTYVEASTNAVIKIFVLSVFAILIDRLSKQARTLATQVDMLEGLLPICSFCKKIRDKENQWQVLEKYISERSDVSFSHGVCPDCAREQYGYIPAQKK